MTSNPSTSSISNHYDLTQYADSVVMLTWSNWFSELRSNRYHYAVRFAKIMPVIFVQPDLNTPSYQIEKTEIDNIVILHVYRRSNDTQTKLLNQALIELGSIKPIFWIYNCYLHKFINNRYSALNIYHGTEDYLASDSRIKFKKTSLIDAYIETLSSCQLIIAVSEGVKDSFKETLHYGGQITTIPNGCDYHFYAPEYNKTIAETVKPAENVAIYQGNIFDKLDYDLLIQLVQKMPDWIFNFCGKVLFNEQDWQTLCTFNNVNYLGLLSPEELRQQLYQSTVGIIPFCQNEWLVKRSLPLKTFEYLAAGLPVVSTPIDAISEFTGVISFADTADEFVKKIKLAGEIRTNHSDIQKRLTAASKQDYDIHFHAALDIINNLMSTKANQSLKLNIAILYEPSSIHVSTINEHLKSFCLYSKNNITYLPATQNLKCKVDLNKFNAIVIHYSIRLSILSGSLMLSPPYIKAIQQFGGYKILFLQDEYEGTEITRSWIKELGIHQVYTCVPQQYKEAIYPRHRFPHVEFINTLTGFTPIVRDTRLKYKKTSLRPILIGYRGRALPFWYGSLGQEKLNIGIKLKKHCIEHGLSVDIEWEESKRIYGDDWYSFLANCRATLGTESGSNIFDFDGNIQSHIKKLQNENPQLSYDSIHEELIAPNEIVQMNQISPKIFESILFNTALILFEGTYSGILTANIHYISLKKDFSNLDDVIQKVQDDTFIDNMTFTAYNDIISSGKYSYQNFIQKFDDALAKSMPIKSNRLRESNTLSYLNSWDPHIKTNTLIKKYLQATIIQCEARLAKSQRLSKLLNQLIDFAKQTLPQRVKIKIKQYIFMLK